MSNDFLASPPRTKKLPFKPTALRRAAAAKSAPAAKDDDDDGLDLFRRSKEMKPIVAADLERRLKRKQKHRELEEQRQAERHESKDAKEPIEEDNPDDPNPRADSVTTGDLDQLTAEMEDDHASEIVTPPSSKRSRQSTESSKKPSGTIEEVDEEVAEPSPSQRRFLQSYRRPDSPVRQSPHKTPPVKSDPFQRKAFNPSNAPVISLDSDSEDEVTQAETVPAHHGGGSSSIEILDSAYTQLSTSQAPQTEPVEEPVEDDEFAEYVRRAEEQHERNEALLRAGLATSYAKEATEIYLSSKIPDTKGIVVKINFDKALRIARDSWLSVQEKEGLTIPIENPEDLVITWRRRKVYSYSTLLSLGIEPQSDGRLVSETFSLTGFTKSRTRVHMELWTPELFHQMELEEGLRRRREAGQLSDEEDDIPEDQRIPEVKLKVILKAQDLKDVKLTIRPETTVETLITGFRTQRGVDTNKDVSLWFDGEKLEDQMTMIEAEIDDMDSIEVHIK